MTAAPTITHESQLTFPSLPRAAQLDKQEKAIARDLVGLGIRPDPWRVSSQPHWKESVRAAIYGSYEIEDHPFMIDNARARAAPFFCARLLLAWRLGRPDLETHSELGRALQTHRKTIVGYLNGKTRPPPEFGPKAADVLGVSLDFLADGKLQHAPLWLEPFIEARHRALRLSNAVSELRGIRAPEIWNYRAKLSHVLGLLLKGNRQTDDELIANHQPDAMRAAVARLLIAQGIAPPQVLRDIAPYMPAMPAFIHHLAICDYQDWERTKARNVLVDTLLQPMGQPGYFDDHGAPRDREAARRTGEAMMIAYELGKPKAEPVFEDKPMRGGRRRAPR